MLIRFIRKMRRESLWYLSGQKKWTHVDVSRTNRELASKKLIEQNYSRNDIAFFYLARQITQLVMERNLNENNFEVVVNETLHNIQVIAKNLNSYSRVLVICGGSHFQPHLMT